MSEHNFTKEEWSKLFELLANRMQARLSFMHDTLDQFCMERTGGAIQVTSLTLQGVYYIVEDMKKEMDEALSILDF